MNVGKNTQRLAASASRPTDDERAAIRATLGQLLDSVRYDLQLASDSLTGPDPEYALFLFVELVRECPAHLRELDHALGSARPVRLVA